MVCPGCGRCSVCGHPRPQPIIVHPWQPWPQPVPWRPPYSPTPHPWGIAPNYHTGTGVYH